MKKKLLIAAAILLAGFATAVSVHLFSLSAMKGDEKYPADSFLEAESNKTAMIITAHDDDAVAFSGTVRKLVEDGWKVHYLTFYGNWRPEDNPIRKQEAMQFSSILGVADTELMDFNIMTTDTVREPWMPVQYRLFANYFRMDSLQRIIGDRLMAVRPSVVFTLDDVTGGYGHPQHVCVSRCINRACENLAAKGNSPVRRIYQGVFPPTLNENVVGNLPVYTSAKAVYETPGMPLPDVEVSITPFAAEKMEVMRAFESQQHNLNKFWPGFSLYPSWVYFGIFDKEYFRVIEM